MEDRERARTFRQRAELLRRLAPNFRHDGARRNLLAAADSWDLLADRLEAKLSPAAMKAVQSKAQRKAGD